MQIGNCTVVLNEFGSTTEKKNVTPAQVLVIHKMQRASGNVAPIKNLVVTGEARNDDGSVRTKAQEYARLRATVTGTTRKGVNWCEAVFPGGNPETMPETFESVTAMTGGEVKVDRDDRNERPTTPPAAETVPLSTPLAPATPETVESRDYTGKQEDTRNPEPEQEAPARRSRK